MKTISFNEDKTNEYWSNLIKTRGKAKKMKSLLKSKPKMKRNVYKSIKLLDKYNEGAH